MWGGLNFCTIFVVPDGYLHEEAGLDNPLRRGFSLNEWQVRPIEGQIEGPTGVSHLEPKVMDVLVLLASSPGQVVERDFLVREVWGERTFSDEPLTRCVAVLRRELGDSPKSPKWIQTVPKRGYRLVAEVGALAEHEVAVEASAAPIDGEESRATTQGTSHLTSKRAGFILLGALALAMLYFPWSGDFDDGVAPSDSSIAVLPFENLSPDPDNAFFADGVHDDLLNQLAKIGSIKVISRTSVLEYRDSPKNMREIGQDLGVATVLEGGVRRAGDKIRINVDLIDAQTDEHIWTQTYDRQLTAENVFAIQSEMATSIANALQAELSPGEVARLTVVPTQNTRAYDFYLNGNDYFRRREEATSLTLALQMYQRAVDIDPEFAVAWAALSQAHSRMHWNGIDRTESRLRLAAAAVERALELAPDLPEAHFALGQYHYRRFRDYDQALEEYQIAARGMPGSFEVAVARAEVHRRLGSWQDALAYWDLAASLDPRNPLPIWQRGATSLALRDYTNAEQYLERAYEMAPDDINGKWFRVLASLLRSGDSALARTEPAVQYADPYRVLFTWMGAIYDRDYADALKQLDEWSDNAFLSSRYYFPKASFYGVTYRLAGQLDLAKTNFQAAKTQIAEVLAANPNDPRIRIALGETLAGLGDRENAVKEARKAMAIVSTATDAVDGPIVRKEAIVRVLLPAGAHSVAIEELDAYLAAPGEWSIEGLLGDPRLDAIRDDPRFLTLVEKYRRR